MTDSSGLYTNGVVEEKDSLASLQDSFARLTYQTMLFLTLAAESDNQGSSKWQPGCRLANRA